MCLGLGSKWYCKFPLVLFFQCLIYLEFFLAMDRVWPYINLFLLFFTCSYYTILYIEIYEGYSPLDKPTLHVNTKLGYC